jgi:hypothetical protein
MPDLSTHEDNVRQLEPRWNKAMIAASIAISFLGAFTSAQLMCHARMSLHFSSVLIWSLGGSVIFGFCSIWSSHEVAMLAYELDLPIGVDAGSTVLSSVLAVLFTFLALSHDLLWSRWRIRRQKHYKLTESRTRPRRHSYPTPSVSREIGVESATPLLEYEEPDQDPRRATSAEQEEGYFSSQNGGTATSFLNRGFLSSGPPTPSFAANQQEFMAFAHTVSRNSAESVAPDSISKPLNGHENGHPISSGSPIQREAMDLFSDSLTRTSSDYSSFRRGSAGTISNTLGMIVQGQRAASHQNAFVATAVLLFGGLTRRNIGKGFLWSIAITGMHYSDMLS